MIVLLGVFEMDSILEDIALSETYESNCQLPLGLFSF
jgi:hypothetical protein